MTRKLDSMIKSVADETRKDIIRRAQRGINIKDGRFKGYSKQYEAQKRRRGGGSRVNLTLTGDMFNSMVVSKMSRFKYRLHFNDSFENDKASRHNRGDGKMPKREFFGISRKMRAKLKKRYSNAIKTIIK